MPNLRRFLRPGRLLPIEVAGLCGLLALASCVSGGEGGGGQPEGGAPGSGGSAKGTGGAPGMGGAPAGNGGAPGTGGTTGGTDAGSGKGGTAGGGAGGRAGAPGAGGRVDAGSTSDGSTTPGAVVFTPNVRLNDDTGNGNQSEVALAAGPAGSGLVLSGWMDERSTRVCAFSSSIDGGKNWSKNVQIPNNTGMFVGDPSVAIDGAGTMYAVCQEYLNVNAGTGNIRMMTSTDKGVTWSAVRTVQSAPDKPWAGGGTMDGLVLVSWLGNPGGIKRSLDHGVTFGPVQSLGNIIHGTGISASNSGIVHVPYNLDSARNQLRYLRSKDNGGTWDAPRDLIPDMGTFCFTCMPRQHPIVGSGTDPTGKFAAITWSSRMTGGQADDDVWLLYSKDGGDTWTAPIRVNDNTAASRQFQSWVAVDNYGRVHLAWTDLRNGMNETWYARSADPTKGFEPNLQITDGRGSANTGFLGDYKGIAVQGPDVLVVWEDTRRDSGDIYFSRAAGAAGP